MDDFCLKGVKSKLLVSVEELAVSSENGLGRRSFILSNDTLVLECKNLINSVVLLALFSTLVTLSATCIDYHDLAERFGRIEWLFLLWSFYAQKSPYRTQAIAAAQNAPKCQLSQFAWFLLLFDSFHFFSHFRKRSSR